MKQKMTIVHIDRGDFNNIKVLTLVAICRGIQFVYATDVKEFDNDDALIFFSDKYSLLGCIEDIKMFLSITDDEKDTAWNIVQSCGKEYEGDIP